MKPSSMLLACTVATMTTAAFAALLAADAAAPRQDAPQPHAAPATLRVADLSPVLPMPADPAVLFADDFARAPGAGRYFEYNAQKGSFVWDAEAGLGGGGGAMRARFEPGQVEAGSLKVVFGKNPFGRGPRPSEIFSDIFWRVYVKHEAGWQGSPAKLARATAMAGTDWSQGLIAHVWSGKEPVLVIDPATGITDGRKVTTRYNDFSHLRWLGLRRGRTPLFATGESGRWVCIESRVRVNTPGRSDGMFSLWVDGRLEAERTDLDWHGAWRDYGVNAVFLENYWNGGSVRRQARWFDGFVVSTTSVGPLRTTAAPILTRTASGSGAISAWQAQAAADPDGRDVVWTSASADGGATRLTAGGGARGAFSGSRAGMTALGAGRAYWLRLRQRGPSGVWSGWSAWHAPFRTAPG